MTFTPLPGEASVMPTYARYPVTLVRGAGCTVWDAEGRAYLDMTGGIGVLSLGHCHPDWVAAVTEAAGTIGLVSNLYATPPQAALAARLAALLPIPDARVFFCNSGAEANEAAIKLIRKRGLALGKPAIVALEGSFHGRTVAALAATGQPAKRAPFEPLVNWFRFVPPGDRESLRAALAPGDVGGVLLEPVMGEGGVHPLDDAYLRLVRELCDTHGALFVVDEVQSGFRCGDWLAISHAGVVPDAACLAKALGGGLPIGALVARADVSFGPGEHATTYGGGPVPSSAALAVLEVIERDGLLVRSLDIGARLAAAVVAAAPAGSIAETRGRGCLWGFELARASDGTPADANAVVLRMLEAGVLASTAGPTVVRMSPPLVATDAEIDRAAVGFGAALAPVEVPA